jgi:solute carrier family 39 (zinc transporter), member 1/2/3
MDASLSLRIASVFIVWIASAVGVSIPFFLKSKGNDTNIESWSFKCMKSCAAGVMLGIALMHLLPDANEDLLEACPDYNLAFAIASFGVILNLSFEQFAIIMLAARKLAKQNKAKTTPVKAVESSDSMMELANVNVEHGEHCGFVKCAHTDKHAHATEKACDSGVNSTSNVPGAYGTPKDSAVSEDIDQAVSISDNMSTKEEEEAEIIEGLMDATDLRELVSLYAMELSISVHSLIIGVDIGLISSNSQLPTLVSLICAIAFHQCMEGMGLGTVLCGLRKGASNAKVLGFVGLFSSTTPIGIIIGICTSTMDQSMAQTTAKGVANALAAGSLLFICLTEMVAAQYSETDLIHRPYVKLFMLGSFAFGVVMLAVIAIWA